MKNPHSARVERHKPSVRRFLTKWGKGIVLMDGYSVFDARFPRLASTPRSYVFRFWMQGIRFRFLVRLPHALAAIEAFAVEVDLPRRLVVVAQVAEF